MLGPLNTVVKLDASGPYGAITDASMQQMTMIRKTTRAAMPRGLRESRRITPPAPSG